MGEKAEREKNQLNQQLLQSQREKVNVEGEKQRLVAQKIADAQLLTTLNKSARETNNKLLDSTKMKAQADHDICLLTVRITQLSNLLQTTDKTLKLLREMKTHLLSILSQLKTIRSEKLADLKEVKEAGEDVQDLLEEIKEINEAIKKSVNALIKITCESPIEAEDLRVDVVRIMKISPSNCRSS